MRFFIGILVLLSLQISCYSNPSNEKIIHGQVDINKKENILNIFQKSDKSIIDWQDFSIKENEICNFKLKNESASVLNRVISSTPSNVLGKLTSNGNFYLLNQNGIVIGKNACLDMRKLVLSTLDISNEEFLNAKDLNFKTDNLKKISNKGKIKALDDIYIFSNIIENDGEIISKNSDVNLIASSDVLLVERKNPRIKVGIKSNKNILNKGLIEANIINLKAQGNNIYSLAINNEGIIDAKGAKNVNGKVILSADEGIISINSKIIADDINIIADEILLGENAVLDVSTNDKKFENSRKIIIGKDEEKNAISKHVFIEKGAEIFSDGIKKIPGDIFIYADDSLKFSGLISSKGFEKDGGNVVFASNNKSFIDGKVDLRSAKGKIGSLTLELNNLKINHFTLNEDNSKILKKDILLDRFYNVITDDFFNKELKIANINILTSNDYSNALKDSFYENLSKEDLESLLDKGPNILIDQNVNISWEENTTLKLISSKNIFIKQNSTIESLSNKDFLAMDFRNSESKGNHTGFFLDENSSIITNGAKINIEGNSGNLGSDNFGIHLKGNIISLNDSDKKTDVFLKATSYGSDNNNTAIFFQNAKIMAKNSNIILDGKSLGLMENNLGVLLDESTISLEFSDLKINSVASGTNSSGISILNSKIEDKNSSILEITSKEAGAVAINLSSNSLINASKITLKASDTLHLFGKVKSNLVDIYIGEKNDGKIVLKKEIEAEKINIYGGKNNNIFYIEEPQKCSIFGSNRNNCLISSDLQNTFEITDKNTGILNKSIFFQNIQTLKGSNYLDDTFIFNLYGKLDGAIDGNGGINTLIAPNTDNLWDIDSADSGNIKNVTYFRNIQNFIGSSKKDYFKLSEKAKILGIIDGKGGYNILDISSCIDNTIIDLHKISNIFEIIGNENNNTLIASDKPNIWIINGKNTGQINDVKFKNFQNLEGSFSFTDKFYIKENGAITGLIDGKGNNNFLYAFDQENIFSISAKDTGTLENALSFKNIQNLIGGQEKDTFKFENDAKISGKIDGFSKTNNTIDFSNFLKAHDINLKNFENIQIIIGNKNSTLLANDIDNIWQLDTAEGTLNENIFFKNIQNFIGGKKNDLFIIENDSDIANINGNFGNNTLMSLKDESYFTIYNFNEGILNDSISFKNISNLIGSNKGNYFSFQDKGSLDGLIDGTANNNTIDFSKRKDPTIIDLKNFINIQNIIGSDFSDILIGRDEYNIWQFTDFDEGYYKDISFKKIENVKGGSLSDIFVFQDNTGLSGFIDGGSCGDSINILDYSALSKPVEADLISGKISNAQIAYNIETCILPNIPQTIGDIKEISNLTSSIKIDDNLLRGSLKVPKDLYLEKNDLIDIKDVKNIKADEIVLANINATKALVYKPMSPFYFTKKSTLNTLKNSSIGKYLNNFKIADSSVRLRNNINTPIINSKVGLGGIINQHQINYKKADDGFDQDDYDYQIESAKEKTIKNKPRFFRYTPKKK